MPKFLILVLVVLLSVSYAQKPNFVFILADDMGWGDMGYNNGTASTPNLDAMSTSRNTVVFERFYSGGPVCSPTRSTVLTGRNHNRECIYTANAGGNTPDFAKPEKMALPTDVFTVAEAAKQAGYTTKHIGKWHLGDFKKLTGGNKKWPVSHPGMHGFDSWYSTERSAPSATMNCGCFPPFTGNCITGHYGGSHFPCVNYWMEDDTSPDGIKNETSMETGDDSEWLVDHFEDFLKENKEGPFMVLIWLHAVHVQFLATPKWREYYQNKNPNYSSAQLDYFGDLSALDVQVGRVRDLLKEHDVADNTMLWFTADNGPEGDGAGPYGSTDWPGSTNGLRGRKRSLFEGGVRVAGMIEWPKKITKNAHTSFPAVSSDFLPTVMDILKLEPNSSWPLDGMSLIPTLENPASSNRSKPVGFEYDIGRGNGANMDYGWHATWVDNEWKLYAKIEKDDSSPNKGKISETYLYNVVEDFSEQHDVKSQHLDLAKQMKLELQNWRESVWMSQTGPNESGCYGTS